MTPPTLLVPPPLVTRTVLVALIITRPLIFSRVMRPLFPREKITPLEVLRMATLAPAAPPPRALRQPVMET